MKILVLLLDFVTTGEAETKKNLGIEGLINANSNVGGLIGYNHGGIVDNCYNTAKVSAGLTTSPAIPDNVK